MLHLSQNMSMQVEEFFSKFTLGGLQLIDNTMFGQCGWHIGVLTQGVVVSFTPHRIKRTRSFIVFTLSSDSSAQIS